MRRQLKALTATRYYERRPTLMAHLSIHREADGQDDGTQYADDCIPSGGAMGFACLWLTENS